MVGILEAARQHVEEKRAQEAEAEREAAALREAEAQAALDSGELIGGDDDFASEPASAGEDHAALDAISGSKEEA